MKRLIAILMLSVILLPLIGAYGPHTHVDITFDEVEVSDSLIASLIKENPDACRAGLLYADSGIFFYYDNFQLYKGLHDYNTADRLLQLARDDRQRTFAYCWKIHLAQDGTSHTFFVKAAIERWKIPNYVIHPITELKIEGNHIRLETSTSLEIHEEFDSLVKEATGRDWSEEAERLNKLIGGNEFYTEGFTPSGETTFGKVQRAFFNFISLFVSEEKSVPYVQLARDATNEVLEGGTPSLDPSGEAALREADSKVSIISYVIILAIIILGFFIAWRKKII